MSLNRKMVDTKKLVVIWAPGILIPTICLYFIYLEVMGLGTV